MSKKAKLMVAAAIAAVTLGGLAPVAMARERGIVHVGGQSEWELLQVGEDGRLVQVDLRSRDLNRIQDRDVDRIYNRDVKRLVYVSLLDGIINPR